MADYIACSTKIGRNLGIALDLVEERSRIIFQEVRKEIKPSTMRHTQNYILYAS
jgi:hypothetical protein